ncbi:hypothetical protein BML2537_16720 [Providencia stuartii]|nr:hypothetical protein BML2537_16720 [Providencia stuartii]
MAVAIAGVALSSCVNSVTKAIKIPLSHTENIFSTDFIFQKEKLKSPFIENKINILR